MWAPFTSPDDHPAMPTGARMQAGSAPLAYGWTSVPMGLPPLPPEHLLRSGGGGSAPSSRVAGTGLVASRLLERDATLLLAVERGAAVPDAWRQPGFAARVRIAREHLAPIQEAHLLAESLAREACLVHGVATGQDAVRVAYAIRWLEIAMGVALAAWPGRVSLAG